MSICTSTCCPGWTTERRTRPPRSPTPAASPPRASATSPSRPTSTATGRSRSHSIPSRTDALAATLAEHGLGVRVRPGGELDARFARSARRRRARADRPGPARQPLAAGRGAVPRHRRRVPRRRRRARARAASAPSSRTPSAPRAPSEPAGRRPARAARAPARSRRSTSARCSATTASRVQETAVALLRSGPRLRDRLRRPPGHPRAHRRRSASCSPSAPAPRRCRPGG